jgi:hypothetical protein
MTVLPGVTTSAEILATKYELHPLSCYLSNIPDLPLIYTKFNSLGGMETPTVLPRPDNVFNLFKSKPVKLLRFSLAEG